MRSGMKAAWLAAALVAVLSAQAAPKATRDAFDRAVYGEAEELGAPLKTIAVFNGGYGYLPDGRPIVAMTVKGGPGVLYVVNAGTREVIFSSPLPGRDDASSAVEVARDGTVYAGGGAGGLYAWRPGAKEIVRLGEMDKVVLSLREAPDGRLYAGTFPSGRLYRYDPKAKTITDLGTVVPGEQYATSLAFDGNDLYIGVGAHPHLVRYDTRTGEKREVPLPASVTEGGPNVGHLEVAGRRLFGAAGKGSVFVLDLDTGRVVQTLAEGLAQGAAGSPPRNGKVYLSVKPGSLLEYDLSNDTVRPAPNFRATTFTRDFAWLKIDGRERLVTVAWSGGMWAYDPEAGQESFTLPLEGQPVSVQAMEKGPDGRLYLSGYPGSIGARYDPATGKMETFALGQAEGIGALGDTLYFGIYPKASVMRLDTSGPLKAPEKAFDIGADQDRPFAFASGGDRLYIGTVPGYGLLGGALTVYDPKTGHTVHRNVIPEQSIIRLAYHDGLVYGSTSVWGGLGQAPSETAAKVFAWDPATGRVVRSATPEHPALEGAPKAINGLAFSPDGRLFAAWQGTLVRMDPKTLKVEAANALRRSNWDLTHSWEPLALRFGPDGLLYAVLAGNATVVDPDTLETRALAPATKLIAGDDGTLFTTRGSRLYRQKRKN